MAIDIDALLTPLSGESPAGENLEYDNEYIELSRLAQGSGGGGSVAGGETERQEPNWKDLRARTLALLGRTRDLRLGMLLTLSSIALDGIDGLAQGLGYIRGLVDQHWDHFYPMLDVEDNNDPTERVMTLEPMTKAPNTFGDTWRFQDRVREAPLTNSRQVGRFGLRHIMIAQGELTPMDESTPPSMAMIEAAFEDTSEEDRTKLATSILQAQEHLQAIDNGFTEKVGAGAAIDLGGFAKLLKEIKKQVDAQMARLAGEPEPEDDAGGAESDGGGGAKAKRGAGLSGDIHSIQDVNRALDKIIKFYEQTEPSSPVPLVVRRAKRLVGVSFWEIIRNLAPDAESNIRHVTGPEDDEG